MAAPVQTETDVGAVRLPLGPLLKERAAKLRHNRNLPGFVVLRFPGSQRNGVRQQIYLRSFQTDDLAKAHRGEKAKVQRQSQIIGQLLAKDAVVTALKETFPRRRFFEHREMRNAAQLLFPRPRGGTCGEAQSESD